MRDYVVDEPDANAISALTTNRTLRAVVAAAVIVIEIVDARLYTPARD